MLRVIDRLEHTHEPGERHERNEDEHQEYPEEEPVQHFRYLLPLEGDVLLDGQIADGSSAFLGDESLGGAVRAVRLAAARRPAERRRLLKRHGASVRRHRHPAAQTVAISSLFTDNAERLHGDVMADAVAVVAAPAGQGAETEAGGDQVEDDEAEPGGGLRVETAVVQLEHERSAHDGQGRRHHEVHQVDRCATHNQKAMKAEEESAQQRTIEGRSQG